MVLRHEMRLSLAVDEHVQYALGPAPAEGFPIEPAPADMLPASGWEALCCDSRGWVWGRRLVVDHDAIRLRAQAVADAKLREESERARVIDAAANVQLVTWFPALSGLGVNVRQSYRAVPLLNLGVMAAVEALAGVTWTTKRPPPLRDRYERLVAVAVQRARETAPRA